MDALADCLETMRRGSDLDAALARYPEHRAQLRALLEVVSLIRPLGEDVMPSRALREAIRTSLLQLHERVSPPLFEAGGEPSGY